MPWIVMSVGLLICACDSGSRDANADKSAQPSPKGVEAVGNGVTPEMFDCNTVAPFASIKELLGDAVERTDSHFRPPRGVPRPCVYTRTIEEKQQMWSFDLDCRDTAHKTASDLITQYTANAGDAGVETLSIGKRGLDHHGVALIFIDDDTPCHVRVMGPEVAKRKELATLVASRLTKKTAPVRLRRRARRKARKSRKSSKN